MPIPPELYPLSTQDGKAINLDIIKPLGMIYVSLPAAFANVTLPAKYNLASVIADVNAFIDTTGTATLAPVVGVDNVGWIFIPVNTVVILELPTGIVKVRAATVAGNMYITALQKYASLSLPRQHVSKIS